MSRLVQCWDLEGHSPGTVIRLSDQEAAAAIAAGKAKGITACRFLVNLHQYGVNAGEIAGIPDDDARRGEELDLLEILPQEPDSEPTPAVEGKGMDHPPADRMIHRAPVTKEAS